jgi:hypothetical protein
LKMNATGVASMQLTSCYKQPNNASLLVSQSILEFHVTGKHGGGINAKPWQLAPSSLVGPGKP